MTTQALDLRLNSKVFGTHVKIARSGERGVVAGFSSYQRSKQPQFYVEYTDSLGNAADRWFHKDELVHPDAS